MKPSNQKILFEVLAFVIGLMALCLTIALLSDLPKLLRVYNQLDWPPFFLSLLTTGTAYLCSALSFRVLFQATPYRIPFPKFFSIMFISDTINFIISSAGMSSILNRAFLLDREKVPFSVTIPLTLAQNMVFNLALSFLCMGVMVYLHGHPQFQGPMGQQVLLAFMAGLLLVVSVLVAVFLSRTFRDWVFRWLFFGFDWIKKRIFHRKADPAASKATWARVESIITVLQKSRARLLLVFFWVALNWGFMALTFYACFRAAGADLSPGLLLVGFTVMFLSSNINPVPAGLGISESLVAFTFKFLGADFEKALVAAILYRLVYFLLPLALSTALYLDRIRSFLKATPK